MRQKLLTTSCGPYEGTTQDFLIWKSLTIFRETKLKQVDFYARTIAFLCGRQTSNDSLQATNDVLKRKNAFRTPPRCLWLRLS
jgi:hypothetical protein